MPTALRIAVGLEPLGCTRVVIALSSWAVDPLLSARFLDSPGGGAIARAPHTGRIEVGLLPGEAAARGIRRLEVCHFHLPSSEEERREFASRAREAGVTLQSLLIDDGDVTHPDHGARDEAWIDRWLDVAEALGFERARVIAGKSAPSEASLGASAIALRRLASGRRLRVAIENWQALLPTPESVNELLDRLEGSVGLCADFGNWSEQVAREGLPAILPRAETIHAKAEYDSAGDLETEIFGRKIDQAVAAGFEGPYVLVAAAPNDVWGSIERTAAFVAARAVIPPST